MILHRHGFLIFKHTTLPKTLIKICCKLASIYVRDVPAGEGSGERDLGPAATLTRRIKGLVGAAAHPSSAATLALGDDTHSQSTHCAPRTARERHVGTRARLGRRPGLPRRSLPPSSLPRSLRVPPARARPTIAPSLDNFYICTVVTLKFNFRLNEDGVECATGSGPGSGVGPFAGPPVRSARWGDAGPWPLLAPARGHTAVRHRSAAASRKKSSLGAAIIT